MWHFISVSIEIHSQNIVLFSMLLNKEPTCFSIIHGMWNYGMWFTCWWGYVIWQTLQSLGINEYISIQDGIIVIIVLICCDLLDLLLSENSWSRGSLGQRGRGEWQAGVVQTCCPQIWKGICPVLWLGSIVFLNSPATATIICIQSKTFFSEKNNLPLSQCLSFCNFVSLIFGAILTLGKQTPKGSLSEETRIMPVVKRVQE